MKYLNPQNFRKSKEVKTLNNINNNTSIHHTPTRMPERTCTRERVDAVLMYCGITQPVIQSCWECRFFEPSVGVDRDLPPADECSAGDCRRHPPVTDHDQRDASANWAVFPLVMACDWCGEFASRPTTSAQRRDDEANTAFDAASRDDATDANRGANVAECQPGRANATHRQVLGTPPETKRK